MKQQSKPTVYISGAHLAANQLFAKADALKLVPPPKNETVEDLNLHCRRVVGLEQGRAA
jgi:hypothetical protein